MPLAPVKSEGEIWSPPSPVVVAARGHLGSKSPPQLSVDMWRSSNGYSSWSDMVLMDSQETEELLLLGGMQTGRCGSLQGLSGGYGMIAFNIIFFIVSPLLVANIESHCSVTGLWREPDRAEADGGEHLVPNSGFCLLTTCTGRSSLLLTTYTYVKALTRI